MEKTRSSRAATRTSKNARVLDEARKLAAQVESWADFCNALFDPDHGIVPRTFPELRDRRAFFKSAEYAEINRLLGKLMDRFGIVAGANPQKSGKFVVRLPKTLHQALEREAAEEGVSLNQLVVTKLAISLAQATAPR